MNHEIIPCTEGDDELIADKLNAITDSEIDYADAIGDELVVFKVCDSDGKIIAAATLSSTVTELQISIFCGLMKKIVASA